MTEEQRKALLALVTVAGTFFDMVRDMDLGDPARFLEPIENAGQVFEVPGIIAYAAALRATIEPA